MHASTSELKTAPIIWRLHLSSPAERVYAAWTDAAQHPGFWCERSEATATGFRLEFIDGTVEACELLESEPNQRLLFRYFGCPVDITLAAADGGTDLTLRTTGASAAEWADVNAGWLNVLLPFKAFVDHGLDLRNHDPRRTWRERFVDQ